MTTPEQEIGTALVAGGDIKTLAPHQAETASTAIAARERASVEARYVMALRRPRVWLDVRSRLLEACRRPGFAATAMYSKPIGGSSVTGLSIRFTEEALRAATNVDITAPIVFDDERRRGIRVTVTDLESNTSFSEDILIEKTVERSNGSGREILSERTNKQGKAVYIVVATEDEILVKQNNQKSKAIRNCGIRVLPGDIVEDAKAQVLETMRDQEVRDPKSLLKRAVDAFYAIGVTAQDLEKFLGRPLEQARPTDHRFLGQILVAIREGETTWDAVMEARENGADDGKGIEGLKARLSKKKEGAAPATEATPEKGAEPAKTSTSDQNSGAGSAAPGEPAPEQDRMGKKIRDKIAEDLKGKTVAQLHKAVREGAKEHGFEDLADLNALASRVTGLDTYQGIQTAEQAADVLYAARVTAAELASEGS